MFKTINWKLKKKKLAINSSSSQMSISFYLNIHSKTGLYSASNRVENFKRRKFERVFR